MAASLAAWRREQFIALAGQLAELREDLACHKAQAALLALAGMFLAWAVATKSLPFALADRAPRLALWLDPGNPSALVARAQQLRGSLLDFVQHRQEPDMAATAIDTGGTAATPLAGMDDGDEHVTSIRAEIAALSRQALTHAPLNARALRLLAEVSDRPEERRRFTIGAITRSRHETAAVYWAMSDALERSEPADAVRNADILLRMGSPFSSNVLRHLADIARLPEGRAALVPVLALNPRWRLDFFNALAKNTQLAGTPFELMTALRQAGSPVTTPELAPYLSVLVREGLAPYAHEIWRKLLAGGEETTALINNADFKHEPSGLPFDWILERGENAIVEFLPLADTADGRGLSFTFGVGRVDFPELTQVLILAPGRYRFAGEMQGVLRGARGLRWELRCGSARGLAKTDMLHGDPQGVARPFSMEFEVPEGEDCPSQQLRLFHDARSSSEQFLSGQAAFQHLTLAALQP